MTQTLGSLVPMMPPCFLSHCFMTSPPSPLRAPTFFHAIMWGPSETCHVTFAELGFEKHAKFSSHLKKIDQLIS